MNTSVKTFEIQSIIFESNDPEVSLRGKLHQGVMSIDTEIIIDQTQLNLLIGRLNKQNQWFNIDDVLESEKMYNDETLYSAILPESMNRMVQIQQIFSENNVKQIRA